MYIYIHICICIPLRTRRTFDPGRGETYPIGLRVNPLAPVRVRVHSHALPSPASLFQGLTGSQNTSPSPTFSGDATLDLCALDAPTPALAANLSIYLSI